MKKLVVSLLLVLAMCLVGCGSDGAESNAGNGDTLILKDFMESITIKGTSWNEYKPESVAKDFGIQTGEIKTWETFYTDKEGKEYNGYVQWDDLGEFGGDLYSQYRVQSGEYCTNVSFRYNEDGYYYPDHIWARKDLTSYSEDEVLSEEAHAAIVAWQEGLVTYLDANNITKIDDLLILWGIDELDSTAYETAIDRLGTGTSEYEFTCPSDYGDATVRIENTYVEDETRIVKLEITINGEAVTYHINVTDQSQGENRTPNYFYVEFLDNSIR